MKPLVICVELVSGEASSLSAVRQRSAGLAGSIAIILSILEATTPISHASYNGARVARAWTSANHGSYPSEARRVRGGAAREGAWLVRRRGERCGSSADRRVGRNRPAAHDRPSKKLIQRTPYASSAAVEHMRVDHRRAHVGVTQKLLDRADVGAAPGERGGEGVAHGVTRQALGDPGAAARFAHG
jgi:hypothetical protein